MPNGEKSENKGPLKVSKATMTDISMMPQAGLSRPKPQRPPRRRRMSFATQDKRRQSNLSDQDVKLARRVWADFVEPNKEAFLTVLYDEFFAKHTEISNLFSCPEKVGLPKTSDPVRVQSPQLAKAMGRLTAMLELVDRPAQLTKLMTKLGVLYAKLDVDLSHLLRQLQDTLVDTVRIATDDRMHAAEEDGLRKCFDLAFSIMEEASNTYYDLFIATTLKEK